MKFLFLFLSFFVFNLNADIGKVKWIEANKECQKKGMQLPTIEELLKIKRILKPGIYWSSTSLKENKSNFQYWVVKVTNKDIVEKGFLDENFKINFRCLKKKGITYPPILKEEEGITKFKAIYKKNIIIFPLGYLSFLGKPEHTFDNSIFPYNFYQFQIRLKKSIDNDYMQNLKGKIIAYDTILMGKVLHVIKMDKYGYEYQILTTPADLLEPYILPDEAIR